MEIISIPHPFWEGNIPFSKENTPSLREDTLFIRKKDTIFNSFANVFGKKSLERSFPTQKYIEPWIFPKWALNMEVQT